MQKSLLKIMVLFIIGFGVYFRRHYYLLLIALVIYLFYKFNLYVKIYRLFDKFTGNTSNVLKDDKKKKRYLKKMAKAGGSEI